MSRTTRAGGWSKEIPTQAGYWYHRQAGCITRIVELDETGECFACGSEVGSWPESMTGEWQPVQPPRE